MSLTPLGSFPDYEEFQCDRTIILIGIPPRGKREKWLTNGKFIFYAAWRQVGEVLRLAEMRSRRQQPTIWPELDRTNDATNTLQVRSIWINPEDETAIYEVYDTTDKLPECKLSDVDTDAYSIKLCRDRSGQIAICPASE